MQQVIVPLTKGQQRAEAFFFGMFGSLAAGLVVWFIQSNTKPSSSSVESEVGMLGIPRSDIERAMNHYGISEEEYLAHIAWYPLPERGFGQI